MAQSFAGIPTLAYKGVVSRFPVKQPSGTMTIPNSVPPSVVPVNINWLVYWQQLGQPLNVGVTVNLQAASVQASILDRIASIKIDNSASSNPIYVQFPDSNDVVTCPPNTIVTFPCLTNNLIFNVFARGLLSGFIPTTMIYCYNSLMPPSVDNEIYQSQVLFKASPAIARGTTYYNTNYGTPALGDKVFTTNLLPLNALGASELLWQPPQADGYIYVTQFTINLIRPFGTPTDPQGFRIVINGISLGPADAIANFYAIANVQGATDLQALQPVFTLVNLTNLQWKLDARIQWYMAMGEICSGGWAQCISTFTSNPT